jgi:hypothetical protein
MRRTRICLASWFVLAAAGLLLGGCVYNTPSEEAAAELRWDPSPNADTLFQRPVDVENAIASTNDANLRMMNQDLGRLLLLDRPSRMTLERIPR